MGNSRGRITLAPLRTTINGLQGIGGTLQPPSRWTPIADIQRGDGTGGVLVQHHQTHLYALWTGVGSIETLPQRKVALALATLNRT
jgi:hypothetical protein